MSLTQWVSECRQVDTRLASLADISTAQWEAITAEALREFSQARPRGPRYASVTVSVGQTETALPTDFLWAEWRDLYYLANGYYPTIQRLDHTWPLIATGDSSLSLVGVGGEISSNSYLTTTSSGVPAVARATAATVEYSLNLRYLAVHQIADPGTNTVPTSERHLLRDLCLGRAAEARAKLALLGGKPDESRAYLAIAGHYYAVRHNLIPTIGGWAHASY